MRIREIPESGEVSAGDLPQGIQILRTDGAGYVEEIQIGTGSYTGEEVQYALNLASPSFAVEEYDGGLRVITRGVGHGYGAEPAGGGAHGGKWLLGGGDPAIFLQKYQPEFCITPVTLVRIVPR